MQVRHYKGGICTIVTDAIHTEDGYELVVYKDEVGNVWARPARMFWGLIEVNGKLVERFVQIN